MTLTFSGSKHGGESFWARIGSESAEALARAATTALTERVILTFYDPEARHLLKTPSNAGRFSVHYVRDKRLTHVLTAIHVVLDLDRDALTDPDGTRRSTGSIRMEPSETVSARLSTAASLARMGHDVILYANKDGFGVGFSTDSCSCYGCTSMTTTTTTTTERTAA